MMTIYDYVMGYSDIPYSDSWTMAISQRDVQNLWVQSPCWVDVGTSISTHTHWWTRKHGWLEFTYLKHVPRPKSRNVNNHVQPPPNNQCLWVSIPYWYFVPGFLHLNQPVRSPLSDLTPWVFRCTGCWTTKRIRTKITERSWDLMPSMTSDDWNVGYFTCCLGCCCLTRPMGKL